MLRCGIYSLILCAVLAGCSPVDSSVRVTCPQRIVSLAPSITETLYALDLGDAVVGVTEFCAYPEEVRNKESVGNYASPDLEGILRLQPDLVVMLPSAQSINERLKSLGIRTLVIRQESVEDILLSIEQLGSATEKRAEAERLSDRLRLAIAEAKPSPEMRPRVLFVVGHDETAEGYGNVYIAGADGFYSHLVEIAGGVNAYDGNVVYPQVSKEGLLRMDPDVIIDIVPKLTMRSMNRESILGAWGKMQGLRAVQVGKVYLFDQDYAAIPGPRFDQLLGDIRKVMDAP